ncbi:MAG: glycerol dehydratase reactivase beta/small subunit family protein [Anaerolineae bacterium]
MADLNQGRPCIHVCLIGGAGEELYRWVEVGAEEEGVPTRKAQTIATDLIAAAYAAAQSSRFDIGLSIAPKRIVLHETHMPPAQPVLAFDLEPDARQICRLMGSNAARLVVRLPLRFNIEEDRPLKHAERAAPPHPTFISTVTETHLTSPSPPTGSPEIEALARAIAGKCGPSTPREPVNGLTTGVGQLDPKMVARIVVRILRERGMI